VEHDPAGQEHGAERQHNREEGEADQLEPHGRQEAQQHGRDDADGERSERDGES
jgi:hypothetical protein